MLKKNAPFLLLLFLLTLTDIYFAFRGDSNRLFTKPLLLPLLMFMYFCGQDNNTSFSRLIYAALISSWLGDIFLLFEILTLPIDSGQRAENARCGATGDNRP